MGSTRSSCGAGGASSRSRPAGGCSTTGSSTSSPPSRRSPSCAGATRASTIGSSSTSPPTRCPSAATCCPAASSPRWSSPTPSCASSRARSGTRTRRSRSRSARRSAAIRSTRTTRARPSTGGGRCRRCCCPDTTRRSAAGGARAAANVGLRRAAVRYHDLAARATCTLDCPRLLFAMSTVIDNLERAQLRRVPRFAAGDRVRVHFQVIEGTRRRTQVFEGVVIKRQGHGVRETFTVRKQSFGVGVERTFPLHSPKIEKIDVAARGDVRRAKLYYLRDRVGKRARVRERRYTGPEEAVTPGLLHDPAAALEAEVAASPEAVDAGGETAEEVVDAGGAADTAAEEDGAPGTAGEAGEEAPAEAAPAAAGGAETADAGSPAEAEPAADHRA